MLLSVLAPAHAEKRVALVVGNDRYANLAPNEQLQKAVNDARAIGGALKGVGFNVIAGENLGRSALLGKLDELAQRLEPGDTAFFFFAGRGVALDNVNTSCPPTFRTSWRDRKRASKARRSASPTSSAN